MRYIQTGLILDQGIKCTRSCLHFDERSVCRRTFVRAMFQFHAEKAKEIHYPVFFQELCTSVQLIYPQVVSSLRLNFKFQ